MPLDEVTTSKLTFICPVKFESTILMRSVSHWVVLYRRALQWFITALLNDWFCLATEKCNFLRGMADAGNNNTLLSLSLGVFVIFDRFCPPLSSCSIRCPKSTAAPLNLRCTERHRLKTSTPSHSPPWSCPSSRSHILLPCAATVSFIEFVTDKPNDWNCARVANQNKKGTLDISAGELHS